MDLDTRNQIILAAVAATGPDVANDNSGLSWTQRVAETASRVTAMLGEQSEVSRAIAQVEAAKTFPATVVSIRKENSSTRGVVTLRTRPSDRHPDGCEEARTERTDQPLGRAMAKRLTALRGHRVMVWIEVEQINGDRKVRVVRWVEDLGVDPSLAEDA